MKDLGMKKGEALGAGIRKGSIRLASGPQRELNGCAQHVIFTDISINGHDVVTLMPTLSGRNYLPCFGPRNATIIVSGIILLGAADRRPTVHTRVSNWFERYRCSRIRRPVAVSFGSFVQKIYIHKLTIGQAQAPYNTMGFTIEGIAAKPTK